MENQDKDTLEIKMLEELIEAKDDIARLTVNNNQLFTLAKLILENSVLNYEGKDLAIARETPILCFVRTIYGSYYEKRLQDLKIEAEAKKQAKEGK